MKVQFKYPTLKEFSFEILSPKFNIWRGSFGYGVYLSVFGFSFSIVKRYPQEEITFPSISPYQIK